MNTQMEIDQLKPLLAEAQDAYCHAIATGDIIAIPARKRQIAKYKKQLGILIKKRMAQ